MRKLILLIAAAAVVSAQDAGENAAQSTCRENSAGQKMAGSVGRSRFAGLVDERHDDPAERPAKYQGREFKTPEEKAAEDKETAMGRDKPGCARDQRRRRRRLQRGVVGTWMVGWADFVDLRSAGWTQASADAGWPAEGVAAE